MEPGETQEQALVRECWEQLAVVVTVGDVFMEVDHVYPDPIVRLTLFHACIEKGQPQKLEYNDIRWITVDENDSLEFCPVDVKILNKIEEFQAEIGQCPDLRNNF